MTEHYNENLNTRRPRPTNRRRSRAASASASPTSRLAMIVLASVVGVIVLLSGIDALASAGRIHPGVSVGGINLGGKSPAEALALLQTDLPKKASVPVTVTQGSQTWQVKDSDVGATFDFSGLLDQAMAVGRSHSFFASIGQRVGAWFGGDSIPAPVTANAAKLNATVDRIASAIDVAPRDAALKVKAGSVTMKPSAQGFAVDRARLSHDLLLAFTADDRTLAARAAVAQPRISDAAAEAAKTITETMVSGPANVTYQAKSWTLSAATLAAMISFTPVESSGSPSTWKLVPGISAKEASKTIVPLVGAALGTPPRDARFKTSGGKVTVVASRNGIGPDIADFSATLSSTLQNASADRTVELKSKVTAPNLTTDQAKAMGVHQRISTFTTTYAGSIAPRINNIHVLGSALDGKLVAPGATFSLNGAVGERTAAKGYQEAFAIVKGKLVPQMGGGICQVATTLFNAVFMSGLPVVERINHSYYLSHYPTGRDATVSWGGPDLRWKNTTSNWVLVSVAYTDDSITVSLYGTSPGYDVTFSTGPFTNDVPYKTTKVNDPTLAVGETKVVDTGVDGKRVVVTRTVKKNGTIVRTDTFTSNYTPKNATVNVGTKVPAASKSTSSTVTPKKS